MPIIWHRRTVWTMVHVRFSNRVNKRYIIRLLEVFTYCPIRILKAIPTVHHFVLLYPVSPTCRDQCTTPIRQPKRCLLTQVQVQDRCGLDRQLITLMINSYTFLALLFHTGSEQR